MISGVVGDRGGAPSRSQPEEPLGPPAGSGGVEDAIAFYGQLAATVRRTRSAA